MGLTETRADVKLVRDEILKSSLAQELKTMLVDNVLPLFEGTLDGIEKEVLEPMSAMGEELDELSDQAEEILHPETAAKIAGTLELGNVLAAELEGFAKKADEVTRKRLKQLVHGYKQGYEICKEIIEEITIPLDEIEDDPEGETPEGVEPAESDEESDDELAAEGQE